MKKFLLTACILLQASFVLATQGSAAKDFSRVKAPNSAGTGAIYISSITTDIVGSAGGDVGVINNATICASSNYFYGVVITSAGSPDAKFNVYDTSGNWAPGTRSITGWVHAGNDSQVIPLPMFETYMEYGLGYTSSGTIPAKLMFLYRKN